MFKELQSVQDQIKALEEQKKSLEAKLTQFDQLPLECKVAEFLHDTHCRSNHTDACGWHYESWASFNPQNPGYSSRGRYYQGAERAIQATREILKEQGNPFPTDDVIFGVISRLCRRF